MKYLILILSIVSGLHCFAQDPQLLENTWYLQNVIIDNQDNFTPVNNEVNSVPAFFSQDGFDTIVCNSLFGFIEYDNLTFSFPQPLETTLILCNLQVNEDFEGLYFSFFNNVQPSFYNYEITTDSNGDKALVVTHANGDQAIYGDQLLAITTKPTQEFSLFPNPVTTILHLHSKVEVSIKKAVIFDVGGKLVLNSIGSNDILVQSLKTGVYFIKIEDEWGNLQIKRFVKK